MAALIALDDDVLLSTPKVSTRRNALDQCEWARPAAAIDGGGACDAGWSDGDKLTRSATSLSMAAIWLLDAAGLNGVGKVMMSFMQ